MTTKEFTEKIENGEAKVLTLDAAKRLKGKKIAWMYFGYEHNSNQVSTMVVGDIVSKMAYAETEPLKGYNSRAEYWRSYMSPEKLKEAEETLYLLDSKGVYSYIFLFSSFMDFFDEPTFTCSDADREVYYIEL